MIGFIVGACSYAVGVRASRQMVNGRTRVRMCTVAGKDVKSLSESDWKSKLNAEQFRVLRMKGTEYPGTGEYDKFYPKSGTFKCVGCETELYKAETKFDSGSGWPSFYEGIKGAVQEETDSDGRRTEILCAKCGGHLGHVFKGEGFPVPTNARHCVNSVSLSFDKE
eukprot:Plantae.Rhodophyta-Purpureofilum_apyrenoidigerum.ctg1874.p1 GENE.Plantae.Rhodophyta-Purpureofilum_apyrenoidigerum.ctg1874~~Plantae.Rhodophyta-Purpureofilum_apyrenoidigerum.ctg1874.p1  ORF type:complete len:166 (+),score=23.10 Plantae.Rhodophyta-Purpureofilum_apyrenoidigerum.ctg1874:129-626(+)